MSANVGCIAVRLVHTQGEYWQALILSLLDRGLKMVIILYHHFGGLDTVVQENDGQFSCHHLLDACNDDQLALFCPVTLMTAAQINLFAVQRDNNFVLPR